MAPPSLPPQTDPRAARRFAFGRAALDDGDGAGAADLFRQTLEIAPDWPAAHFALGEALEAIGETDAAEEAYAAALARDPRDALGATLRLARLTGETPAAAPAAHMRALFDEYAPRFDAHLVDRLGYRAPQALRNALDRAAPGRRFSGAADLGCGAGLCGQAFRDVAARLVGVDLSPGMIAEARRKAVYDDLVVGDVVSFLEGAPQGFDLLIAGDVLVYLGDLAPLFRAAARALAADGLFLFSVQQAQGAAPRLLDDLRFGHPEAYLRRLADEAGFAAEAVSQETLRRDRGADVAGLLATLRRVP